MPTAFPAVKMFHRTEMENYKLQVEMLQEKLQRSEEKRKQIEEQFYKIQKKRIEHEKSLKSRTRAKFEQFLDEQQTRNERNKSIIKMLDKIDEQTVILQSRSEKLKMMKQQYEFYFGKLLQHQAMEHSPRYSILPLTQQAVPSAPQFLTTQNALNYYPSNVQNIHSFEMGLQPQQIIANNMPVLNNNQILTTPATPSTTNSAPSYPITQHPTIITNPNDFIYRYPMNPYDYYNSQIILNQPQPFQQQIQTLQQPAMLQIPIQQHQIPPLPLGIPLRTGGIIPIASPSTTNIMKPNFEEEFSHASSNYIKQKNEPINDKDFEKIKKLSSDFKYTNNNNDDNKYIKTSTKSYPDNYDLKKNKFYSLDEIQNKEKQRQNNIYDDYSKNRQGIKNNEDEDDDYDDDEMDEKDSLQQSPKSTSDRKRLDNDYVSTRDRNNKKENDSKANAIPLNNNIAAPMNISLHLSDDKKYSIKPNSPKERTQKNMLDEKFSEISLKERKPIDITKYPDGYYLHDDEKASKSPSHMWNFTGRIENEKGESQPSNPMKFEKKEKLSIENIENAIYGELIDPTLSDLNEITEIELKTPLPMRPELMSAKYTDFKEKIDPKSYLEESSEVEKVPSPKHALNLKITQPVINKNVEYKTEYVNPELKNNYENVKYNALIQEPIKQQSVEKTALPQIKPDELQPYESDIHQKTLQSPNSIENKVIDQVPQYEQSEYDQYDPAQYDQTQYDQSLYNQQPQFESDGQQQQYNESYNDPTQAQYDDQKQDYQYPTEQTQDYTTADYQNYDAQQYPEGYDASQYQNYNYDQSDPNYQQDTNQQYSENYDQQAYDSEQVYQPNADYQNYDTSVATDQLPTTDQIPIESQQIDPNPVIQNVDMKSPDISPNTLQENTAPPASVSPKKLIKEKTGAVKPILSKEKSMDSENKKKKRVNFIDSSDESSVAQKPETNVNESDFDFSSSN